MTVLSIMEQLTEEISKVRPRNQRIKELSAEMERKFDQMERLAKQYNFGEFKKMLTGGISVHLSSVNMENGLLWHLREFPKSLKKDGDVRCMFTLALTANAFYTGTDLISDTEGKKAFLELLGEYPVWDDSFGYLDCFEELSLFKKHLVIAEVMPDLRMIASDLKVYEQACSPDVQEIMVSLMEATDNNGSLSDACFDLHRSLLRGEADIHTKTILIVAGFMAMLYDMYQTEMLPPAVSHYLVGLRDKGVYIKEGELKFGSQTVRIAKDFAEEY